MRSIFVERLAECSSSEVSFVELEALDDRRPRATSFVEVPLGEPRELPGLPADARAFVARAHATDGRLVAWGVLNVEDDAARGPLFPLGVACRLLDAQAQPVSFPPMVAPSRGSDGTTTAFAGGREADGQARADLVLVDPRRVVRLGMRRRRAQATVVIVGDRVIVAGGEASSALWEDAEVIVAGTLAPDPLLLAEPRAEAAGVALPSGEACLVGGRGLRGALRTLEALDPSRRVSRSIDLASLARPRIAPVALRFATGELAVFGGRDDAGQPVPDVEVFDPTATRRLAVLPLPAYTALEGVALSSGALLAVGRDASGVVALLLRPDGVESLPRPAVTGAPHLVPGTDGAPLLVADVAARYEPFTGTFAAMALPALVDPATAFPYGPGAFAWLGAAADGAATVRALRFDVRTPWVSDPESLGLGSTDHLVPDRLGVTVGREGLVLPPGARVAVADATYGAFSLRLGAAGRELPDLELRDARGGLVALVTLVTPGAGPAVAAGEAACSWPIDTSAADTTLTRRAGELFLRAGAAERRCAAPEGRVTLTLVARTGEARVRGLTIERGP